MSSQTLLHADRRIPRTPWMSLHTQPSGSLGDPKGIPGSSLDVPHTQPSRQSGGSQGHPRILHSCPTHIALQAVWRSPRRSQNPRWMSPHAWYSIQSGGSQGYPRILPWCSHMHSPPGNLKDAKDIPRSSLDVSHIHSPCCPDDPNDVPISSFNTPTQSPLGSPEDPKIFPGCPHTQLPLMTRTWRDQPGSGLRRPKYSCFGCVSALTRL